jgi:hypothetical protein
MTNAAPSSPGTSVLKSSIVGRVAGACLAVLFVAAAAWARAPVGTISGTVHDQSSALIPQASIPIGMLRPARASRDLRHGRHVLGAALAPGEYVVIAELPGFRTQQLEVTVATGKVLTIDMRMEVGGATGR